MEAVGVFWSKIVLDTSNSQVHLRQLPGRGIRLLTEDADVADASAVRFDELLALHKHSAGTTARIKRPLYGASISIRLHDAARRVELSALLAFSAGELPRVFVDRVHSANGLPCRRDRLGNQVDQFAELRLVERGSCVSFGSTL